MVSASPTEAIILSSIRRPGFAARTNRSPIPGVAVSRSGRGEERHGKGNDDALAAVVRYLHHHDRAGAPDPHLEPEGAGQGDDGAGDGGIVDKGVNRFRQRRAPALGR